MITPKQEASSSLSDFLDNALESRRWFSEMWGTFLLVTVAAGGGTVSYWSHGAVSIAMAVVAPGLMVMAIIYFMGTVSGAHLNPAVTFAFAVRRNFPWSRVPGYIIAQFIGAMLAVFFLKYIFGDLVSHGATIPANGISPTSAMLLETMLTAGLVSVILGTASGARNIGTNGAIAVGGYIALAGLWSAPITGASMNPFRSLAPDILRGDLSTAWIYIVGPLLGALIGVAFEWILKGSPTSFGAIAAQGTLELKEEMLEKQAQESST
jgi:aquaporin Z